MRYLNNPRIKKYVALPPGILSALEGGTLSAGAPHPEISPPSHSSVDSTDRNLLHLLDPVKKEKIITVRNTIYTPII